MRPRTIEDQLDEILERLKRVESYAQQAKDNTDIIINMLPAKQPGQAESVEVKFQKKEN